MPHFLGIGAQKAATTWLYTHLARHPQLAFPAGKELHFWNRREGRAAREWLDAFDGAAAGLHTGEITPAYACLDSATIEEIHRCAPGLRIFYSLRNPIERAWSAALMALARAELEPDEASDAWFLDHFRSRGSLARGDYEGCLRRWRTAYPAEQIQLVFFDDILEDPHRVLAELAEHLGVDPQFYATPGDGEAGALRRAVRAGIDAPIRTGLLPVLHEIYDERIDSLEKILGRDLSSWRSL